MPTPPQGAFDAIIAGQSRITRRIEIYEADAVTTWSPGMTPRMTAGSVSVDYSRDDRRNLDLTLDNTDGLISHSPNGGLWYDKVIKLFRGVKWENTQKNPKIAFWDIDTDIKATQWVQNLGFVVDRWIGAVNPPTINDIFDYDILLIIRQGMELSNDQNDLAEQAYAIGINVFTLSPYMFNGTVPFVPGTQLDGNSTSHQCTYVQDTSNFGSPFAHVGQFTSYSAKATRSGFQFPVFLSSGGQAATSIVESSGSGGNNGFGLVYAQNSTSAAKWAHYSVPLYHDPAVAQTTDIKRMIRQRDSFLHSIFVWLYAYDRDKDWECQIGEFLITQINTPRAPRTIQITGTDYQYRCANSTFDNAISYDPGEDVDALIRDFAANAGITKFRLNGGGAVTDTSYSFDSSSPRWDAMKAVAEGSNLELFFDAQGYLVTRPFFDPSTSTATLILKTGEPDGNLGDWSESSDPSDMYNRVVVSSDPTDETVSVLYQGIAENHEPSSPTSIENLGYARTYHEASPFYTSEFQCQARADSILRVHALENYQIAYTSIVFAWLEAGEIIEIDKPDNDITDPTRWLNVSFTIPLTLDAMTGTAKRITIVG